MQVHLNRGRKKVYTRNGLDWTKRFTEIAGALAISGEAVIDGEVVVVPEGRTNSELAAGRQGTTACRGAAVWSSVRYGHRPQRLSHHYLSKQRTAGTLELGDTPQEQTVGRKDDRKRLPLGCGRPICGEARAGRISCRFVERGKAEVRLRQLAAVFDTAPLMQINGLFWHPLAV